LQHILSCWFVVFAYRRRRLFLSLFYFWLLFFTRKTFSLIQDMSIFHGEETTKKFANVILILINWIVYLLSERCVASLSHDIFTLLFTLLSFVVVLQLSVFPFLYCWLFFWILFFTCSDVL
jgi:hypothetical protein